LQAADIAGIRGFAVHAKDDQVKTFYERFDFIASPTDPCHLFRFMKDVRVALAGGEGWDSRLSRVFEVLNTT